MKFPLSKDYCALIFSTIDIRCNRFAGPLTAKREVNSTIAIMSIRGNKRNTPCCSPNICYKTYIDNPVHRKSNDTTPNHSAYCVGSCFCDYHFYKLAIAHSNRSHTSVFFHFCGNSQIDCIHNMENGNRNDNR